MCIRDSYSGSHEFGTTLVEGIVDIYPANSSQIITRLQKDEVFLNENGKCRKAVLPSYEYLRWKEGLYCFDDAPFSGILGRLEKYYNVKITVASPQLLNYGSLPASSESRTASNIYCGPSRKTILSSSASTKKRIQLLYMSKKKRSESTPILSDPKQSKIDLNQFINLTQ